MMSTAPKNSIIKTMNDGSDYVCINTKRVEHLVDHNDFDLTDARGRKVGSFLVRVTEIVTARAVDSDGHLIMPLENFEAMNKRGIRYGYELQATRDGKSFGACNHTNWFNSRSEMEAASDKALENSRKRAERKFS